MSDRYLPEMRKNGDIKLANRPKRPPTAYQKCVGEAMKGHHWNSREEQRAFFKKAAHECSQKTKRGH